VSPAKTAELIEMPFGLRTWVSSRNHVLDGSPDPHGRGNFEEGKGRAIVKCRDTVQSSMQKQLNQLMPFMVEDSGGPRKLFN